MNRRRLARGRFAFVLGCACVLAAVPPATADAQEAAKGAAADGAVAEWLVVAPLDRRGRRPFNPDVVFATHLLDAGAAPPKEGDKLIGERGEEQTWARLVADEKGHVGGRPIGYAYATVASASQRVVIARLRGASRLYVNGEAYVGDVYGYGFEGVPVALRKGANDVYVSGVRGRFRLTLREPRGALLISTKDATLPSLIATGSQEGAVAVHNPSTSATYVRDAANVLREIPPLGSVQLTVRTPHAPNAKPLPEKGRQKVPVRLRGVDGEVIAEAELAWPVRRHGRYLRTFRSRIDGSTQMYAIVPPAGGGGGENEGDALVLSLHGASVPPMNQARAYSPKPGTWIVVPTNRRPFGFDWQDWGRIDAYEVLAHGMELSKASPDRVYLTGHSMGGHGTWHLAANDPDRFAAIAPSAGWATFDTYAGGRPAGELHALWKAADGASLTLSLIPNLVQIPTYVLHGEKDDNVPASEARRMLKALRDAGAQPTSHFQPDAGHWWDGKAAEGADCVDWPEIFALFGRWRRPANPDEIDFKSMDVGIDSEHHWVRVEQPLVQGKPMRVKARWDRASRRVEITTRNVRRIALLAVDGRRPERVVLDGDVLQVRPFSEAAWFVRPREGAAWERRRFGVRPEEKGPERCGPFKRAFDHGFVLVHGTSGNAAEDAALFGRARYDQQQWRYRANGDARVLSDVAFLTDLARRGTQRPDERNVILYGNEDTNAAWGSVLPADVPVSARRGSIRVGESAWEGDDLAGTFVYPRRGRLRALVGVFADTGVRGSRLGHTLLTFVSGVGYPDYAVFDSAVLTKGDGGVLAAGWFDHAWGLQADGFVRGTEGGGDGGDGHGK